MKKIGIFILIFSIFSTTFFISNKLSAQVTQPLPTIGLKPIKSTQKPGGKGFFGGFIVSKKVKEINSLESGGYTCEYSENTIEIKNSMGSNAPTKYLIENYIIRKNIHPIKQGQAIMGFYSGTYDIECIKYNEDGTESRQTVTVSKITKFLTSSHPVK